MIATALALSWAGWIVWLRTHRRRGPAVRVLPSAAERHRGRRTIDWSGRTATTVIGGFVRRRARRDPDSNADQLLGEMIVGGVVGVLGVGYWGIAVAPAWWWLRRRGERRKALARDRAVVSQLPDVAALLAIAAASGRTVQGAVSSLGATLDGPVSAALLTASHPVPGSTFADRLDSAGRALGPPGRPLISLLASSERDGAPIVEGLHRLAADARVEHRRALEEDARRAPVRLLGPLVFGTLPAFFLLTVVPLIGSAALELRQ